MNSTRTGSLFGQKFNPSFEQKNFDSINTERHFEVQEFEEHTGSGLSGKIYGNIVKAGSKKFVGVDTTQINDSSGIESTRVYVSINDAVLGYFVIKINTELVLKTLLKNWVKIQFVLLSGDNESEKDNLKNILLQIAS